MSITVLKPGLQTTIQSRPRVGYRHIGVPTSGAADPLSLALANKLVGNNWQAPALEASLSGPTLRFDSPCAFALAGANAEATLNAHAVASHETQFAEGGDVLDTGAVVSGARLYVAFAGGLLADDVMGSPSTYLLAGLGGLEGRALIEGDVLRVLPGSAESLRTPDEFRQRMSSSWALRACVSAETQLLSDSSYHLLFNTNWIVDRRADRMGLKLKGPALEVSSTGRMPSAGVICGTIQCPEDGAPYALSVDAGTVGGYPRIAQVARCDRHLLGQLRPGDRVRLLLREAQSAIDELRAKLDYWRPWIGDIEQVI